MRFTSEPVVRWSPWTLDPFSFLVLVLPVVLYFALTKAEASATTGAI